MTDGAYSTPILIREGSAPELLDRIALGGGDGGFVYDEAFICQLAFAYPTCIPVADIDPAYMGLVPVCTELGTPAGPLDALYVTASGRLCILEAKLWRNPEARRKVVAQVLDYAKELSRWDYSDLQRELRRKLGRKDNVLYNLVKAAHPGTEEAPFVDAVEESLRRGRFLLLILGDGIRQGAGAIAEFLESVGSLEFTFGLVELALYRDSRGSVLVQPRVIARTVEFQRVVLELPPGVAIAEPVIANEEETGRETFPEFYQAFWEELLSDLRLDDASQPLANPAKGEVIRFPMPPNRQTAWITAYFSRSRGRVGVFLTWARGTYGDAAYDQLSREREAVERDLGMPATWYADGDRRGRSNSIVVRHVVENPLAAEHRQEIKTFFSDTVNRFVNTFRPRLERIGAERL